MNRLAAVAIAATVVAMAACSRPQPPKVEITKPLDTAKGLQDDLNKKAEERGAAADQLSK